MSIARPSLPYMAMTMLIGLAALVQPVAWAQPNPADAAARDGTVDAVQPAADPAAAELMRLLESSRSKLVDTDESLDARRTHAEILVGGDMFPARTEMIVQLLANADTQVRELTLAALIEKSPALRDGLPDAFVDPLIGLLHDESPRLRELATRGLSMSSDGVVSEKLAELAADDAAALPARLAAVEAMANNIDERSTAAKLISLLDTPQQRLRARLLTVLRGATGEDFNSRIDRWQEWWQGKAALDEPGWRAYRLRYHRQQAIELAQELKTLRSQRQAERERVSRRLADMQRSYFRALPREYREPKLAQWLADPSPEVRLTSLDLVAVLIGDEGFVPTGDVLAGMIKLLSDDRPEIRAQAVHILQNVQNDAVVDAILARLKTEEVLSLRKSAIEALGKLGSAKAIPALLSELQSPDDSASFVHEAATAIGDLAARLTEREGLAPTVKVLIDRYARTPADDIETRAALLRGMVGVGDAAFADVFAQAVDGQDSRILGPAIRGLIAVKNISRQPRLRELLGNHPEAQVRLGAAVAIGRLGRAEADVEALFARLSPASEQYEPARKAAWAGYRAIMNTREYDQQLTGADRLRDFPDLRLAYLQEIEQRRLSMNGSAQVDRVQERIARLLAERDEPDRAWEYFKSAYKARAQREAAAADTLGLDWLAFVLRGDTHPKLGETIKLIMQFASNEETRQAVVERVAAWLERSGARTSKERAAAALEQLKTVPVEGVPASWLQLLAGLDGEEPVPSATVTEEEDAASDEAADAPDGDRSLDVGAVTDQPRLSSSSAAARLVVSS